MINRRDLLVASAAGLFTSGLVKAQTVMAQSTDTHDHSHHDHANHTPEVPAKTTAAAAHTPIEKAAAVDGYRPVVTPNGRTLGYRMNEGVKEFHLIAEEVEHEFGPGNRIKAWGYNGSTPGPTIEAVEGDRVRIYVTNKLPEHTTVHWHGILLPWGMDGISGLTQPPIKPGETWVYEFTLEQNGTYMYHPHADEMVQMAMGMMGMFIIHPKTPTEPPVDRDYAVLLHNWAVHPGTYRPDPSVMTEFDLWTMNSKVFPFIDSLVAQTGERVRIRMGNLSMWNHPMHLHGVQFDVTGSDGGRWPQNQWRKEVTEIVGVGQTRDIEFIAVPGDWAFHCHMSHHTMNAMGHGIPNTLGANQKQAEAEIRKLVPGYMAMGEHGMAEHQEHVDMGHMPGPANTLPMMMGEGPYGKLEMGGMFTLVKVRDHLHGDPGWYSPPEGTQAKPVQHLPEGLPT
ncbi:multicopper oxidase family protein [Cellvibrio polysaccharolyticus]|uniref:Copper oxidase n=1 Tax=Cellvibrio polysaccharolyticus TaxID=2082724 RepID=A0A928V5C0_9GAMM|nr:copper oxidase [Cellvibrio polysaccharolyticus]MBE8717485.1 copper oxidase [Cellvibrio polysaccharolyticus]